VSATLLLEPIGGISGDLFLGAMADLGVDLRPLTAVLEDLGVRGFRLRSERTSEHGIAGTRVTVDLDAKAQEHSHRPWSDIRPLLERLPAGVTKPALAIFGKLASAEGKVHGVAEEAVEFHEIGAVDSIVDIVGAAWALNRLGNPRVVSRAPPLGSGTVRSQHGVIPVPAPATLQILAGLPTLLEGRGELTTPTGAAILAACADFELPASFRAEKIGYGIGHTRFEDRPNVLRASLGMAGETPEQVYVLETHLDDLTPQLIANVAERLLGAGALDVALSPLWMKKGRPGQRLTVVCRAADRKALTEILFRESSTLGVRSYPVDRDELDRRVVAVETPYGAIRIKLGSLRGELLNAAPEFDDCVAAARRHGVPLKEVMASVTAAARAQGLTPGKT